MRPGEGLDALMSPRSIAIIGASQEATKIGGRPVDLLRRHGYAGHIYPVNPKAAMVQGLKAYASVADVPEAPDLAIIAVDAERAGEAVEQCAARGVRSVVVFSSGFAELGEQGRTMQDRLRVAARNGGMRLLGPNCLGAVSIAEKSIATFSIVLEHSMPAAGSLGIVSQSGNLGSYTMRLASERGVGVSRFITTGNECDVDIADGIAWMARDPATKVILCCLEACRDAGRLIAALEEARDAGKPVIAMKIGTSAAGQAAAASHTGAMAGSDAVFDALFARCGAVRVRSIDELIDLGHAASILLPDRLPKGPGVAVLTASGGFGVLIADAAQAVGLTLPELGQETQRRILDLVPFASARNPVDATAQMSSRPDLLEKIMSAVVADERADTVILPLPFSLHLPRLRSIYMDTLRNIRAQFPIVRSSCASTVRRMRWPSCTGLAFRRWNASTVVAQPSLHWCDCRQRRRVRRTGPRRSSERSRWQPMPFATNSGPSARLPMPAFRSWPNVSCRMPMRRHVPPPRSAFPWC